MSERSKKSEKDNRRNTLTFQVVLYVLMVVTLGSVFCFRFAASSDSFYEAILGKNGELDEIVLKQTEESFNKTNSIINVPAEKLFPTVDKDKLLINAHSFTLSAVNHIFHGTELNTYEDECKAMKEEIDKFFDENKDIYVSETERQTVKDYYVSLTNNHANYISPSLVKKAGELTPYIKSMGSLVGVFFGALLLCLVMAGIIMILNKDNLTRGIYKVVSPCWLASVTLFAPALFVYLKGLSSKIGLAESGLKRFVTGFIGQAEFLLLRWGIIHFAVFTAFLIASVIVYSVNQNKRHKKWKK